MPRRKSYQPTALLPSRSTIYRSAKRITSGFSHEDVLLLAGLPGAAADSTELPQTNRRTNMNGIVQGIIRQRRGDEASDADLTRHIKTWLRAAQHKRPSVEERKVCTENKVTAELKVFWPQFDATPPGVLKVVDHRVVMTSNNMYRVGDFVYFEVSASAPYQIRKIEELNKTSTGAVEAKVVCFYRRRDLALNLIQLADKHQQDILTQAGTSQADLLHQIRHRELFLSRQLETLPATHIRGKCTVTLHSDTEPFSAYLSKEDAFFFQLVYDPLQKTLQADRGTIREGPEYQADVPPYRRRDPTEDDEITREELRWKPNPDLTASDLDSYLLLSRSLGTLGRAYYCASSLRQPSLSMSAAAAARDSTHQLALDTLHAAGYNVCAALQQLSPNGQPTVRLDEMESWSASEGNLFEEALEKYGKCFFDIQSDFLPWKHPKSLIDFYYMWKTTDHYIQQKRLKAAEAEHNLKQVYIPNYNKPNPAVLYPTNRGSEHQPNKCEGCQTDNSPQWYALGPTFSPLKVCADCWAYWKRYGDLKASSVLDKLSDLTSASDQKKTDASFKPTSSPHQSLSTARLHLGTGGVRDSQTSVKLADGISFQFLASPLLRIARHMFPASSKLVASRRQGRCPFDPHSTPLTWQSDVLRSLASLDAPTILRFTQRLRASLSHKDRAARSAHLRDVLTRIFPALGSLSHSTSTLPSNVRHDTTAPIPSKQSRSTPATSARAPSKGVPPEHPIPNESNRLDDVSVLANRKRPNLEIAEHASPDNVCLEKKPCLRPEPAPPLNQLPTRVQPFSGPKRRIGIGPDANGVLTLMYRASESIKRYRRKALSLPELRRIVRRPCSAVSLLPNGLDQCPQKSTTGLSDNCGNSTSASSDSRVKKDGVLSVTPSSTSSTSNAVAP